ncbi:AMP-binding protein [Streptomyces sp. NPDC021020]|uniref:AMP-binding protein n=1 Tax=Streptomyces sp. NPDC021020 TaxID=3365109 RepID=UPI003794B57C
MDAKALTDVLRSRAEHTPDSVAYEFAELGAGVTTLTYGGLAARASVLAAQLTGGGEGPVLLAYDSGLEYPVAVFAAFLAGRPLIPAYPPGPMSDGRRLAAIVDDARPTAVLAAAPHPEIAVPTVLSVPGAEADGAGYAPPPGAARQDIAIVQYTSGSTGTPKGVLVRQDSVAANTASIAERFGLTAASRGLTWLPPFHDMGLIGGLLAPVAAGIPVRILRPVDFLKAPLWWLRQIGETGATASGGPDFAYALCVRRARTDGALEGLDLSRWQVAFNGGESVRHRTMAAFAERFAPAGFRAQAFLPCYGLAEATLMVSAGHWSGPGGDPLSPVSCGTSIPGQRIAVVDPERLTPVADGTEGEIWVAGPNVTPGHLHGDSSDQFAELDGRRFLRTGDIGYLRNGELFPTGRVKDVIVFRGVNHHAVDVEAAALEAVGRVGRSAAAFLVDAGSEPLPVLVLETLGRPGEGLVPRIRAAVLERTNLRLAVVALVPPRSLPRTSSGKIRRSATRDALLAGAYDDAVIADGFRLTALAERRESAAATADLAAVICGVVAEVCGVRECRPADSLTGLGLDSVQTAEAAAVIEDAVGLPVPLESVLAAPTANDVADALLALWVSRGGTPALVRERLASAHDGAGVG